MRKLKKDLWKSSWLSVDYDGFKYGSQIDLLSEYRQVLEDSLEGFIFYANPFWIQISSEGYRHIDLQETQIYS